MSKSRTALLCGGAAIVLVLIWQYFTVSHVYGGNWTGLFCIGSARPLPPELEPTSFRFREPEGYDGQFYRLVAHDPVFTKGLAEYLDDARLRYTRILVPGLAFLAGGGRDSAVDGAYILLIAVALGLGVFWAAQLLQFHGKSALWSFGILLLPGSLTSMDRMLVDGVLASLTAGFWLYLLQERWRALWLVCLAASLTRETGLLLPLGAMVHFGLRRDWPGVLKFMGAALPAIIWILIVQSRTPPVEAWGIVFPPLMGILRRIVTPRPETLLLVTDGMSLAGLVISLILTIWWLMEKATPAALRIVLAGFACLGLILGAPVYMIEPYAFTRPIAPLFALLFVEGILRRSQLAVAGPLLASTGVILPILATTIRWL